jgi:hypothetical protein
MTHEELTDDEALTAALLLGLEFTPIWEGMYVDLTRLSDAVVFNGRYGPTYAAAKHLAARAYLRAHNIETEKTPEP